MNRIRQLLGQRLLRQSQCVLPTSAGQFHVQQWLPLQRELSLSCPALYGPTNSNKPGDPPGGGNDDDNNKTSASLSYGTISDILNVVTKSGREKFTDRSSSSGGEGGGGGETEDKNAKKGVDPTPVINYPGKSGIILGIETSCDDTGVALVNTQKQVLGEALNSQLQIHLNHGGIIPPVAKHLHEQHIVRIIREAFEEAKCTVHDVDAIATTVKPGLSLSLLVGLKHGKQLCIEGNKPFIPIHHMQAHAVTCRMLEDIDFPYLVLLVSGGHCLLALAKSIDTFEILGTTIDDAPGEAFDKTARRLKLHTLSEGSSLTGGAAIEYFAKRGNPDAFKFPTPMYKYRDCNWSFAGLKFIALRHILHEERAHGCEGSDVIPSYADLCASFQYSVVNHLCKKVQRGMIYADMKKLIPDKNRVLVISGGVAANDFVKRGVELVCQEMNYRLLSLPKKLCTDNGVMIAWNGVEKFKVGLDIIPVSQLDSVDIESKCPMGISLHEEIRQMNIKCKRIKLTQLFDKPSGQAASTGGA